MRRLATACAILCASLPARGQQVLPEGHLRILIQQIYAQQTLPAFTVPHLIDEETANALLHSQGKALFGDFSPRDLSQLSPGMSFSGKGFVLASVPQIDYGLTGWLTVSAIVPWYELARTLPRATASSVLLGYNLDYNPRRPVGLTNFPFAFPFVTSRGRAVTGTEAAQQIFTNLLGYHRIERFDSYGLGDPYAALTFALVRRPKMFAAATVYAQLPLGRIADPNDPFSINFGDGHTSIGSRISLEDREGWPLAVTVGVRSLFALRDHPVLRIYSSALIPLASSASLERVSRLVGPQLGAFVGVSRVFANEMLRPSVMVGYDEHLPDHLRGSRPSGDYAAVEDNSRWGMFSVQTSLAYTTVERFLAGQATFPGEISLYYYYQMTDHGLFAGLGQHRLGLTFSSFY